jgi:hypothetical protein
MLCVVLYLQIPRSAEVKKSKTCHTSTYSNLTIYQEYKYGTGEILICELIQGNTKIPHKINKRWIAKIP